MNYKVFYRKYRPKNFFELIGQDNIKEILINSIKSQKIAHAYIFTGPRGTGKTSTAKIFAKTLNCTDNSGGISCDQCNNCVTYNESPDIIEIDAASNNGVEEIRSLRDSVKIAPYSSKYKVYIIDEVHMLSNSAWNAFLKTLEEPPAHVIFILATTEVNKIPETVMSRCQRFDFSRIQDDIMFKYLYEICKKEQIDIEDAALCEIIKLSSGCLRDALSYLDQISKFESKVTTNLIESNFGVLTNTKFDLLIKEINACNKESINLIIDSINNSGITPLNFINNFMDYLLNLIIENNVDVNNIKKIVTSLNNLVLQFNSVVNPYTLIKIELMSYNYFPGNNSVNISQEIIKDNEQMNNNSKEFTIEFNNENSENCKSLRNDIIDNISSIKKIRINNSFYNASKELKKTMIDLWNKYITNLSENNDYKILGLIENSNVQVVSKTNVIFSLKADNEAILFNNNLDIIESNFNKYKKTSYKFICLSEAEWKDEMSLYIKSDKNYKYIDEKQEVKKDQIKSKEIAENIFGDDIIEIR